jgi:aconitate hydratase
MDLSTVESSIAGPRRPRDRIGMSILPRQFKAGERPETLGLSGLESYTIEGIAAGMAPGKPSTVRAKRGDGSDVVFTAMTRRR